MIQSLVFVLFKSNTEASGELGGVAMFMYSEVTSELSLRVGGGKWKTLLIDLRRIAGVAMATEAWGEG